MKLHTVSNPPTRPSAKAAVLARRTACVFLLATLCISSHPAFAASQNAGSCRGLSDVDASTCIQNFINAAAPTGGLGGEVFFPAGDYYIQQTLHMKHFVTLRGEGPNASRIRFIVLPNTSPIAATTAIDAVGSSAADRIVFSISDLSLEGSQAAQEPQYQQVDGIRLGHNNSSNPILRNVRVESFPGYGIHFVADDWDISFDHVAIWTNGRVINNGSGIFKDPGIVDLNAVTFNNCLIEGNGSPSSAAGGVFLMSTSIGPMKQIVFRDGVIQGNVGSDQFLVAYASGLVIDGVYGESDRPHDSLVLFEIDHSSGLITGTRVAIGPNDPPAPNPYANSIGIKVSSSPGMKLDSVVYSGNWQSTSLVQ